MRRLHHAIRAVLLLACLGAVVGPAWADAAPVRLAADFDGDGQHDSATLDVRNPAAVQVWLSTTGLTSIIHARAPIVAIVATDLDGDRRSELIATSSTPGLQVWSRTRHRFHRLGTVRPHRAGPATLTLPGHRNLDDGPLVDREDGVDSDPTPRLAVASRASPRAPDARLAAAPRIIHVVAPLAPSLHALAPRPPPALA